MIAYLLDLYHQWKYQEVKREFFRKKKLIAKQKPYFQ